MGDRPIDEDRYIVAARELACSATGKGVVVAWGAFADRHFPERVRDVTALLGRPVFALAECKDGSPHHLLWLPHGLALREWRGWEFGA